MGMRVIQRPDGSAAAEPCQCQLAQRIARLLRRSNIPKRYEHCTLESYELPRTADATLRQAHLRASGFVDGYPVTTEGKGLLLTGNIGVGKTHLAVGMLIALIREKSVRGLFCDYRELLKQIQHSYNAQSNTTELDILRPVFDAEVLVLDELGAAKPTEWVWDTVALILNTRYNDKRTTIITTNYPDLPPGAGNREETLGDRIGERMRSRLSEMCVPIEMRGSDFRQGVGKARFS
jgi:DNA replication protein DnaC